MYIVKDIAQYLPTSGRELAWRLTGTVLANVEILPLPFFWIVGNDVIDAGDMGCVTCVCVHCAIDMAQNVLPKEMPAVGLEPKEITIHILQAHATDASRQCTAQNNGHIGKQPLHGITATTSGDTLDACDHLQYEGAYCSLQHGLEKPSEVGWQWALIQNHTCRQWWPLPGRFRFVPRRQIAHTIGASCIFSLVRADLPNGFVNGP